MRKSEIRKYWQRVNANKIPSSLKLDMDFSQLSTNSMIIDLGCGCCDDLRILSKKGYQNLYGIDINKDIQTLTNDINIHYSSQDVTKLSFLNESFDYAIMKALLTVLVTDTIIIRSLQETNRVLKNGAILHIEDFFQNWHMKLYRDRYLTNSKIKNGECIFPVYNAEGTLRYYARHFNIADVSSLLVKTGFDIEDIKFKKVTTQSGNQVIGFKIIARKNGTYK